MTLLTLLRPAEEAGGVSFPHRDYEPGLAPWTALLTSTVTYETDVPIFGGGSAKVVTPGVATFEGITSGTSLVDDMVVDVAPSTEYTLSCYVRATATGAPLRPRVTERTAANAFVANITFANVTPVDATTTRYSWTWTTSATTEFLRDFRMMVPTIQARTFYVDGWQLDLGAVAQPYDGDDAGILQRSASVTASGSIAVSGTIVSGVVTHERSVAVTATGSLAVVGQRVLVRSAAVSATGTISTAGVFWTTFERSVALSSTGSIATVGRRVLQRSAVLSSSGAIAASGLGWTTFARSIALSATSSLTAVGHRILQRSASVTATGSTATSGTFWTTFARSVGVSATSSVVVAGEVIGGAGVHQRSVSLTAVGGIAVASQRVLLRSAVLTSTGLIATGRQVVFHRSVALFSVSGLSVNGSRQGQIVSLIVALSEGGPSGVGAEGGSFAGLSEGGASAITEESSGVYALID